MFLQFCLLAAAQVTAFGSSQPPSSPAPQIAPPAASTTVSAQQAEQVMVHKFNQLVYAMKDFAQRYRDSHTVNARKAREVRRAWKEFQTAQEEYLSISRQGR